jgi:hypothetical protein
MLPFGAPLDRKIALISSLRAKRNSAMFQSGNTASQITPRLFLSDLATAYDVHVLRRLGITHILSVLDFVPNLSQLPPSLTCLHVRLEDRFDADILAHLPRTTDFIRTALAEREDAKVLVRTAISFPSHLHS